MEDLQYFAFHYAQFTDFGHIRVEIVSNHFFCRKSNQFLFTEEFIDEFVNF